MLSFPCCCNHHHLWYGVSLTRGALRFCQIHIFFGCIRTRGPTNISQSENINSNAVSLDSGFEISE